MKNIIKGVIKFFKGIIESFKAVKLVYKYGGEKLFEDPLTGCLNRVLLEQLGEREINRAKRYEDRKLYCIFIDVDGLKLINDGWDHEKGDEALKKIVEVLKAESRGVDILLRLGGGDEFLLLMVEAKESGPVRFKEAVSKKLSQISIGPSLSVTMGVAFWEEGLSLKALMHKADVDLLRKKKKRKV